jgi:hypothetical protein
MSPVGVPGQAKEAMPRRSAVQVPVWPAASGLGEATSNMAWRMAAKPFGVPVSGAAAFVDPGANTVGAAAGRLK